MRFIMVVVWALILGVFTCTGSLRALFYHQHIRFEWNPLPDFDDLFITNDFDTVHAHWVIIKFGHFLGFALLDILLYLYLKHRSSSVTISALFAVFTEILQLYFNRDGRLYDMAIDIAGVIFSAQLIPFINRISEGVFQHEKT